MGGTLSVQVYNPSSTEYISGAEIQASADQLQFPRGVSLGDIGALGTTLASLPFKVREDAVPGNYVVTLTLAYISNVGGTTSGYKKFSIPVTISPTLLLQVENVEVSKSSIAPGDSFVINATLVNKGGRLNNMILSYPSNSNFSFDGQNQILLGDLESNGEKRIVVPLIAGERIKAGYYSVALTLKYDDAVSTGKTEELLVGPISAVSESSRVTIYAETQSMAPGSTSSLKLRVKNTGDDTLFDVHVILPEEAAFFVPLDFSEKIIPSIESGEEATVEFQVGVSTNAEVKAYSVPLTIRYQGKTLGSQVVTKNVGLRVAGTPELAVIASTSPAPMTVGAQQYKLSVQVSNVGNTAVRAVAVYVSSETLEFLGSQKEYVGTLNLDDYSTSQFPVVVKPGTTPGTYEVSVELTYKDAYNNPYRETHKASIEVVSSDVAALARGPTSTNPFLIVGGIVLLAAVLYFGYNRFLKKKKPELK